MDRTVRVEYEKSVQSAHSVLPYVTYKSTSARIGYVGIDI